MPEASIVASISPTENPEKVREAIDNLFPGSDFEISQHSVRARARSLDKFSEMMEKQKIQDTARSILLDSISGSRMQFWLGKQAAFMGRVNFTDGCSVLGDLEISIEGEDPESIVHLLTANEGGLD